MATTLNYVAKFTGDSTALKSTLSDLNKQLTSISNTKIMVDDGQIKEASTAAQDLQKYLAMAMDTDTGELDLTKLSSQLKNANTSVTEISQKLLALGPEGTTAFTQFATAISQAQAPMKKTNALLDDMWNSMKMTAKFQLSNAAINAVVGSLESAVGFAKALDGSLNSIRVVTGKSTEEMAEFAIQANAAAKALSTTTVDYTDASLIYYQQGDSDELVKEKTDITVSAANAAGIEAAEMSEYLTAVWNSYQVGAEDLEVYVDIMAKLGAETASSLEEISTAMQKVAATGNAVGVDFAQLSSILSTVSSVTRESPETVGTAYKTIFARIGDLALGETGEDGETLGSVSTQLKKIGIDVVDTNGDLRDMGTVVEEIGWKWQGMSDSTKVAVAQAVAGKRQYTQLVALFDNWDMYQDNMEISMNAEGAMQEMQDTFSEGWEAARNRLKASFEGMVQAVVQDVDFAAMANGLAKVTDMVTNLVDNLGGLQNIAILVASVFVDKFSNNITKSLDGVWSNLKLSTGEFAKNVAAMQGEVSSVASEAQVGANPEQSQQLEMAQGLVKIKGELANAERNLSDEQRAYGEIVVSNIEKSAESIMSLSSRTTDITTQIKENTNKLLTEADKYGIDRGTISEYTKVMTDSSDLMRTAKDDVDSLNASYNKLAQLTDEEKANDLTVWGETFSEAIKNAEDRMTEFRGTLEDDNISTNLMSFGLEEYSEQLRQIKAEFDRTDLTADDSNTNLEELINSLSAANEGFSNEMKKATTEAQSEIQTLFNEAYDGQRQMEYVAKDSTKTSTEIMQEISDSIKETTELTRDAMQDFVGAVDQMRESVEKLSDTMTQIPNETFSGERQESKEKTNSKRTTNKDSGTNNSADLKEESRDREELVSLIEQQELVAESVGEASQNASEKTQEELEKEEELIRAIRSESQGAVEDIMQNFYDNHDLAETEESLERYNSQIAETENSLNNLLGCFQDYQDANEESRVANAQFASQMEQANHIIEEATNKNATMSEVITSSVAIFASAGGAAAGLQVALNAAFDPDLTMFEKGVQIVLGMGTAMTQLNKVVAATLVIETKLKELNLLTIAGIKDNIIQVGKNTVAKVAETKAKIADTIATAKNTLSMSANTVATGGAATARGALAASTGGATVATGGLTAATGALTAASSILVPVVMAIAAAYALYKGAATYVNNVTEEKIELAKEEYATAKASTELAKQEVADSKELAASMSLLLEKYKETGEGKEELDAMAESLTDKYGVEGSSLAKLTGKYEDYLDIVEQVEDVSDDATANLMDAVAKQSAEFEKNAALLSATDSSDYNLITGQTVSSAPGFFSSKETKAAYNSAFDGYEGNESKYGTLGTIYATTSNVALGFGSAVMGNPFGVELAKSNLQDIYGTDASDSGSTEAEKLIDKYERYQVYIEELIEAEETNSEAFKNASEYLEANSDLYADALDLKLQEDTFAILNELETDSVIDYSSYNEWSDSVMSKLEEMGYEGEELKNVFSNIVSFSGSGAISEFSALDSAISSLSRIARVSAEDMEKFFEMEGIDSSIAMGLDWSKIFNESDFIRAYEAAEKYKDVLTDLEIAQKNYNNVLTAQDLVTDGISGNSDTLFEMFDWGSAETDFMTFTQFVMLSEEEALSFLSSLGEEFRNEVTENLQLSRESIAEELAFAEEQLDKFQYTLSAFNEDGTLNIDLLDEENAAIDITLVDDFNKALLAAKMAQAEFDAAHQAWEDAGRSKEGIDELEKLATAFSTARGQAEHLAEEMTGMSDFNLDMNAELVIEYEEEVKQLKKDLDKVDAEIIIDVDIRLEDAVEEFNSRITGLTDELTAITSVTEQIAAGLEKVGDSYALTAEQAMLWAEVYPEILRNATTTSEGLLLLNQNEVDSYLAGTKTKYESSVELMRLEIANKIAGYEAAIDILDIQINAYTSAADAQKAIEAAKAAALDTFAEETAESSIEYSAEGAEGAANNISEMVEKSGISLTELATMITTLNAMLNSLGSASTDEMEDLESQVQDAYAAVQKVVKEGLSIEGGVITFQGIDWSEIQAELDKINDEIMMERLLVEKEMYIQKIAALRAFETNLVSSLLTAFDYSSDIDLNIDSEDAEEIEEILEKIVEELVEAASRLHEITKELEYEERILSRIQSALDLAAGTDRLDLLAEEAEQLEKLAVLYEEQSKATFAYMIADQSTILGMDSTLTFDSESGAITNYSEALQRQLDTLNAAVLAYNASEQTEEDAEILELARDFYDDWLDETSNYEDYVDAYHDSMDAITDNLNAIFSNQILQISTEVELKVNVATNNLETLDYYLAKISDDSWVTAERMTYMANQASEYVNQIDAYTQGINELIAITEEGNNLNAEQTELLEEYISAVQDANLALLEINATMKEEFLSSLAECTDEIDKNIEQFDKLNTIYDQFLTLMELTGADTSAFGVLDVISEAKIGNAVNGLTAAKGKFDLLQGELTKAEQGLADAYANDDAYMIAFWTDSIEEIQSQLLDAQADMNDAWISALEMAAEKYEAVMEGILDNFSSTLAGSFDSIDSLTASYEDLLEVQSRYLSASEQTYELSKLNREIATSIDSTSSVKGQQALLELQEEIAEIEESGKEMSEYDLEYLQAKYDLKLAEIALEEAQNNNTSMRLVKDASGNYKYAYTADEFDINSAEQDYEDALRRLEVINEEYNAKLAEDYLTMLKNLNAEVTAIREDTTLTHAEQQEKIAEIIDKYADKYGYLGTELEKLMENSGIAFSDTQIGMMTGLDEFEDCVDLFTQAHEEMMEQSEVAWQDYADVVEQCADAMGLEFEDFNDAVYQMASYFESSTYGMQGYSNALADTVTSDIELMADYLDSVIAKLEEWKDTWVGTLEEVIAKSEELIEQTQKQLAQESGVDSEVFEGDLYGYTAYGKNYDYDELMKAHLANGGSVDDLAFAELMHQSVNQRIANGESIDKYDYDTWEAYRAQYRDFDIDSFDMSNFTELAEMMAGMGIAGYADGHNNRLVNDIDANGVLTGLYHALQNASIASSNTSTNTSTTTVATTPTTVTTTQGVTSAETGTTTPTQVTSGTTTTTSTGSTEFISTVALPPSTSTSGTQESAVIKINTEGLTEATSELYESWVSSVALHEELLLTIEQVLSGVSAQDRTIDYSIGEDLSSSAIGTMIDLDTINMENLYRAQLSDIAGAIGSQLGVLSQLDKQLEQYITINADFPDTNDVSSLIEAFETLSLRAQQYASIIK